MMLWLGLAMWAGIIIWLCLEFTFAPAEPILPSPNHLSCGQCFWITREQWVAKEPFPSNPIDQLIISVYCSEHNSFSYKRWGQRHLDDKGLFDVDNYRGFLED